MTTCYFDCIGGAAGDMILAALLDAGASRADVDDAITGLNIGAAIQSANVSKNGIRATKVNVIEAGKQPSRTYK
ncbi:MAG: DUF111 family protein, partial [Actinomycetota bacterium]|nr:DUF111 family protein [Actinomycetota bacterium]